MQELSPNDFVKRQRFCEWSLNKLQQDPNFFHYVLFSDEATFHKNGSVNKHNLHYYDDRNPNFIRTVDSQHRWSINVWAGMVGYKIVGPHFFEENLNGQNYEEFLRTEFEEFLDDLPLDIFVRLWFQQDGAPAHFSRRVRNYLDQRFPNKWIGRGGPINWPPRSPDLTKLDYFLWGTIKDIVYKTPPSTRDDMKNRIIEAFQTIRNSEAMLQDVNLSFHRRVQHCLNENGGHIEQFL